MSIYKCTIHGATHLQPFINSNEIKKGSQDPYIQHSYEGLEECPCKALDRFSTHGGAIREAYEDAVVDAVTKLYPHQDSLLSNRSVSIVVIGSGGLLQEAFWLQKLYQLKKVQPVELSLYLVDKDYVTNDKRVANFAVFAKNYIVPPGCNLNVVALKTCDLFKDTFRPTLIIGMDTEHATGVATNYQWVLRQGDLEKTLFVKWENQDGQLKFKVYSRQGSGQQLEVREFDNYRDASHSIKASGLI